MKTYSIKSKTLKIVNGYWQQTINKVRANWYLIGKTE